MFVVARGLNKALVEYGSLIKFGFLLTWCGPKLLTEDVRHARETDVPVHEVSVESAAQECSQENSLCPNEVLSVRVCDGVERIVGVCCRWWDQSPGKESHCEDRRQGGVVADDVDQVDGSGRWLHVRAQGRGCSVGSHSLMDFEAGVSLLRARLLADGEVFIKFKEKKKINTSLEILLKCNLTQRIRCFSNAVNDSGASPLCNGVRTKTTSQPAPVKRAEHM